MKKRVLISSVRSVLSHLLVGMLVLSSSLIGQDRGERNQRDGGQRRGGSTRSPNEEIQEHGFATYSDGENSVCRDLGPEEVEQLRRDPDQTQDLHVITQRERDQVLRRAGMEANVEATGLKITLRATTQLDGFPEAKAAFIRAAATWEAQIKNPISIIIDVDYGTTWFGQAYSAGVLGSTRTSLSRVSYDTMRARLLSSASSAAETALYNALPTGTLNTDIGAISNVHGAGALMRALGLLPADATSTDLAPAIGFNAAFPFDFDPSDGITARQTDFDAVAVHEMGHALGFISNVGAYGTTATSSSAVSAWDIFRFRPGTTSATFTSAPRIMTTGGEHRFFDGQPELACSTGGPNGTGGDSRQASHWKDDSLIGTYIGIMDPTLASGVRKVMTANDLQMLETIGYTISGTLPPPPCTFTISPTSASAPTTGAANGTVGVTASASTCTWSATSNALPWLTVTAGASGTGSGTVGYAVQAHTGASRSGTLTIAGQTFTVNQSGCSFTFSFTTNSFPATVSMGSVTVNATGTNCPWTAASNSSWIKVTGGASGTGTGAVTYELEANPSTSSRTGSLTIAGRSFSVTQAGVPCSYTVGSFNPSFTANGGSVTIPVTTTNGCTWRATENVSWLSFSPSTTVTGSRSVVLTANAKNSTGSRSTTVTIAGKTFTITQSGR